MQIQATEHWGDVEVELKEVAGRLNVWASLLELLPTQTKLAAEVDEWTIYSDSNPPEDQPVCMCEDCNSDD